MSAPQPQAPRPADDLPLRLADVLAADDPEMDVAISDEEANAEIDMGDLEPVPVMAQATPAPEASPTTPARDDSTPSVRVAINKAADILRELRDGH